jgi:hypothetical protein
MRRPIRIQAKSRWADDDSEVVYDRPPPPSRQIKFLSVLGMLTFWLYYLGVLGKGDHDGVETGFLLFVIMQLPLLWAWLRHQSGGR